MSFAKTVTPQSYSPSPPPSLPGAEKLHLERELMRISQTIEQLKNAVVEIQNYLESLP